MCQLNIPFYLSDQWGISSTSRWSCFPFVRLVPTQSDNALLTRDCVWTQAQSKGDCFGNQWEVHSIDYIRYWPWSKSCDGHCSVPEMKENIFHRSCWIWSILYQTLMRPSDKNQVFGIVVTFNWCVPLPTHTVNIITEDLCLVVQPRNYKWQTNIVFL